MRKPISLVEARCRVIRVRDPGLADRATSLKAVRALRDAHVLGHDPIFRGGSSRPASNDDAMVFRKALSEAAARDRKPVAEKADRSVEAADLHASVGVTDTINAAATMPDDLILDELRRALDIAASKALERL